MLKSNKGEIFHSNRKSNEVKWYQTQWPNWLWESQQDGTGRLKLFCFKRVTTNPSICGQWDAFLVSYSKCRKKSVTMLCIGSLSSLENTVTLSLPTLWESSIKVNSINILDGYPQERNDQLAMILSTIGKPNE